MTRLLPTIWHIDADAFFVSVELAARPELRGKKVAVGGRTRGIISSASYEARAAGVYTPMPTQSALRVCPDLILLPHEGDYGGVSRRMFDICEDLTPHVQRNSIDEGYLDVGPCGLRDLVAVERAARELQSRIWAELQIPVSFGLASNRLLAQVASKLRKPRGFVIVPPGEEEAFLAPLPIKELSGVGTKSQERLKAAGIHTFADVTACSESKLEALFGSGWRAMQARCRGIDDRPVETERDEAKSYSHQETFGQNVSDPQEIERVAKGMIDDLLSKVRRDGKQARTLTMLVRYADFTQASSGRSLPAPSDIAAPFYALVPDLLRASWKQRRPLRLVSVRFSGIEEAGGQMEFFDEAEAKRRRIAGVLDQLNARGGPLRVQHGHQIKPPERSPKSRP